MIVELKDCMTSIELADILMDRGYNDVWFEDTDAGVVVHGISLTRDEGGQELIVPEEWNNR